MLPTFFRAAAILLLVAAPVLANPAGKDSSKSTAEAIRKALDEPVSLEVGDQALPAVLAQLSDIGKVPIVLDRNALQMMGMEANEANVTLRAKEMKLKTAIRTVAGQHGLSFAVVGDHVLVSSEDIVCQRQLKQRVSFDLDDVAFAKALTDLSRNTATNVVLDPRMAKKAAEAKVTLKLDDVPLETAVRIIAEMAGLKPARMGNVLFVTSEERADKLKDHDQPANPALMPGMMMGPGIAGGGGGPAVPPNLVPAAPAPAPPKDKEKN